MKLYSAADLHSNNHFLSIIDEQDKRVLEKRLPNNLAVTLRTLEPYRAELVGIAVESTFNWCWLVDGLAEAGYSVKLVNTEGTWPTRITIQAGPDHWEFLPDLRGRMPDMLGGAAQSWTPQNEGRWRRIGDKRELDVWFAWGEVAPSGRAEYQRVYRS